MSLSESFTKWREKKKEEKEEFKKMERELKFKKLLEEKQKTPHQKELDFYEREKTRELLKQRVESERKVREQKMKDLSNPFNKKDLFSERNDIMRNDVKWV